MVATLTASEVYAGFSGVPILRGVDLTLTPGQPPLGLVGPSGVGKTTLLNVLAGTHKPDQGRVLYEGHDVTRKRGRATKEFRAAVRFVSQDSMTIREPRETAGSRLKNASQIARKGGRSHNINPEELLQTVGLGTEFLGRRMMSLSGGERQRVALATALATRPKILVLDEPLTAVEPSARGTIARTVAATIEKLGMSVLIASHDLELISRLCPEIAFLSDGAIVERGSLSRVLTESENQHVRELAEYAPLAVQRFR